MYKLREMERRDIPAINKWRNNKDLIDYLGAPFRYINSEVDSKWFDSYMASRGSAVRCAVCTEDCDDILGLISLVSINHMNGTAELHIMVGNSADRGKGLGTFAVKEMLRHAFYNLNLHRVELTVVDGNERAKHLYEKVGFVFEGTKRSARYKNGKYVDMLMYSILREEFNGQEEN